MMTAAGLLLAQRGGGDWMTTGYDAQRSSWLRGDGKITPETMKKPGFKLLWKFKLNNAARQMQSSTPPALLDFYISYRGFRTLGFVGGSSDTVTGIDTDLARLEWERNLGPKASKGGTAQCPGGMTSAVTRPTYAGYPAPVGLRGFGRGNAAKSGVGEPGEGAVTLQNRPSAPFPPPPPTKKGSRTAPASNPFGRNPLFVLAISGDGKLHSMYVSNGEEPKPAVPFLPAGANATGLIAYDGVAYAATTNKCNGVENGVWAINLESGAVTSWKSGGANVAGFASAPDGALFVAAGNRLVALEPGTLKEKATFAAGSQSFTASPVIFEFKGKDLLAVPTGDGKLHLFDTTSISSPIGQSGVYTKAGFVAQGLASWQDDGGTRWVLAPASGAAAAGAGFASNGDVKAGTMVAFKVVEKNGAPALEPGWASRDLESPITPMVVNGIVFAVSSGAEKRSKAVLYALDGMTGKELWNSGDTLTSFVSSGGLSAGGGRVYLATHDGTQYAFGFHLEI